MELVQKTVQMQEIDPKITHQIQMSEDINVSDSKEDMMQIIQGECELHITEVVRSEEYLKIMGCLEYAVLYVTENEEKKIACLDGKVPVEEFIYVEAKDGEDYHVTCNQLDYETHFIHSRKINIKAMIELQVEKSHYKCENITTDICADIPLFKRTKQVPMLQAKMKKKDIYRIKEEVKLPGTKENIGSILMTKIGCYKLDTRVCQDSIQLHGEMQFFCMYLSDECKEDWISQTVNFEGGLECYGVDENTYVNVCSNLTDLSVEAQPDEDGEVRILSIEATLEMDLDVYQEDEMQILEDVYSLEKNCQFASRPMYTESLCMQNYSKCRMMETLEVPELKDELLQICMSNGRIQIEKVESVPEGILIEGILHVHFLYVKEDDCVPYGSWQGMVPFSHIIDCKRVDNMTYSINSTLEQLSVGMSGNDEIEVKAIMCFCSFVRKPEMIRVIEKIEMNPFTKTELESQAGIIGYICKEGDELWTLAKRYHTTTDGILKINKITEKDIKEGQRLLIFKENVSIL